MIADSLIKTVAPGTLSETLGTGLFDMTLTKESLAIRAEDKNWRALRKESRATAREVASQVLSSSDLLSVFVVVCIPANVSPRVLGVTSILFTRVCVCVSSEHQRTFPQDPSVSIKNGASLSVHIGEPRTRTYASLFTRDERRCCYFRTYANSFK